MKTIYFMRHAKSDWQFNLSDVKRPLNERGMRDAPNMGFVLREKGVELNAILCSPAVRAHTTANLVASAMGYSAEVLVIDSFYYGDMDDVIELIKKLNNRLMSVLLVGHNPTWESLVTYFCSDFDAPKYSTAGVSKINFDIDDWKLATPNTAQLAWYIKPKDFI